MPSSAPASSRPLRRLRSLPDDPNGVTRPVLEGSVAVRDGRRLSFAEFGVPHGEAIFWLHGTPGSRRQVPVEARRLAAERGLRIIGIDRPGIGSSTQHLYAHVLDFAADLEIVADTLGIDRFRVIGLSGGGPYTLGVAKALPERVEAVAVLGGVAPTKGPDAISGGLVSIAPYAAPVLAATRVPLGFALAQTIRLVRPLAGVAIDTYAHFQPAGDKQLLARPEFRAMFLDDLLNGARFQVSAPLADVVLFTRPWGFELGEITVPVHWWHGDDDHIIPHAHGVHAAARIPGATFHTIEGESHLGGLGVAERVLTDLLR